MGYNTEFRGELKFTKELTGSQLAVLSSYLGEDCRNHPEWGRSIGNYYVNLSLLPGFDGLEWDGSEKTYEMVEIVNFIIDKMMEIMPDFGLTGKLLAQGEDIDDRWELIIKNNVAVKVDVKPSGTKIQCPHCGESFYLE